MTRSTVRPAFTYLQLLSFVQYNILSTIAATDLPPALFLLSGSSLYKISSPPHLLPTPCAQIEFPVHSDIHTTAISS